MPKILFLFIVTLFLLSFTVMVTQWKYIPEKAMVKFYVKEELGVEEGVFGGLEGKVHFDENDLKNASFTASVKVNTVNSGVEMRDESLRSKDFFEADKYPLIHFKSDSILQKDTGYCAIGKLTIKKTTKIIEIPFRFQPESDSTATFNGGFSFDRYDYGVGAKGDGVGNWIRIELKIPVKK